MQIYNYKNNSLDAYVPRLATDVSSLADVMALLQFEGASSAYSSHHVFSHRRLRTGQTLYSTGQRFNGLYVVRSGSMKSVVTHDEGNDNVIAFHMRSDMLGCDGIHKKQYCCDVVALTDCEVVRLPSETFFNPGRSSDDMEQMLYWAISREMAREQIAYAVSHATRSEVRVARFLVQHSEGFARMGCSPRRFTLTMTRRDIGSYLSVTLETVSRALSMLHQLGVIAVANREVTLLDVDALRTFEG